MISDYIWQKSSSGTRHARRARRARQFHTNGVFLMKHIPGVSSISLRDISGQMSRKKIASHMSSGPLIALQSKLLSENGMMCTVSIDCCGASGIWCPSPWSKSTTTRSASKARVIVQRYNSRVATYKTILVEKRRKFHAYLGPEIALLRSTGMLSCGINGGRLATARFRFGGFGHGQHLMVRNELV